MLQSLSEFVDYVRGLDWTPQQLQFLAIVVGVPISIWIAVRMLTWPFRARARKRSDAERAELISRLAKMDEKLDDFDGRVTRLGIEEQSVGNALETIVQQRVSALSSGDDAPFVRIVDEALVRRLETWLRQRGLNLVENYLGKFVQERMRSLPDQARDGMKSVVDSMARDLLEQWLAENPQVVKQFAHDSFGDIVKERYTDLPVSVKAPLYTRLDERLSATIGEWLEDENDRNFNDAAGQAFRALLTERFANLPADLRERLLAKCDTPLVETVESWLEDEDDQDVRDTAEALLKSILASRGTALDGETRARLDKKVDEAMESLIGGWLDDGDDDDLSTHATEVYRMVLRERQEGISPDVRKKIGDRVDSGTADLIGEWIDNGADDEDLNSHAATTFRAILSERLQSLPPATKEDIGERIDAKLGELVDTWLEDPSDNEDFSEPAASAFRAMVTERLSKLPDHVRARIQKSIDDAFKNEAQRILDELDEDDDLSVVMRERLKQIASGKNNW